MFIAPVITILFAAGFIVMFLMYCWEYTDHKDETKMYKEIIKIQDAFWDKLMETSKKHEQEWYELCCKKDRKIDGLERDNRIFRDQLSTCNDMIAEPDKEKREEKEMHYEL